MSNIARHPQLWARNVKLILTLHLTQTAIEKKIRCGGEYKLGEEKHT